jgi:hypothetical protein
MDAYYRLVEIIEMLLRNASIDESRILYLVVLQLVHLASPGFALEGRGS